MKKSWIYTEAVVCLLGGAIAHADIMSVSFDAAPTPGPVAEQSDFFTLETVDFNRERRREEGAGSRPFSAISLTPKGVDVYVEHKRNVLAQEHADRAEEFVRQDRMEDAVQEIDQALLRDPDNMPLLGRAGLIYAAARRYEEASAMLRVYLQNYPDQVNHLAAWGGVLLRLGEMDLASVMLARSLRLDPDNVMARYQMDVLLLMQEKPLEADHFWPLLETARFRMALGFLLSDRAELEELIGTDGFALLCDHVVGPGTATSLPRIRETLDRFAENERAPGGRDMSTTTTLCEALLNTGMHNQGVRMVLAQAYYETDRLEEAWRVIRAVQESYPDYQSAWFNGGLIALQMEHYELAEIMFRKALTLRQDGVSYFALACAYASMGKLDEAWTLLHQLQRTEPENLAKWLEGESAYLMAIKQDPRYEEIRRQNEAGPESGY